MHGVFLDSNIFIYMFDEVDQRKRHIAEELVNLQIGRATGTISFQVVQETLNVVNRDTESEEAVRFLQLFMLPLWKIMPSQALYEKGLELQHRYRYSFYDSLIITAALEAECETLYSEDFQDGQKINGLTIRDPFRVAP